MKIIRNSLPVITNMAAKPFKWVANCPLMKKACDKFEITPEKAMDVTTIASIVGKDSIGCYMYVKQSLNNDKIPEEKRSFVAALDLTNGALMIAAQLLMYKTINNPKVQKALFGKVFKKVFGEKARKSYYHFMRSLPENNSKTKADIYKGFDTIKDQTQSIFGYLTSLIAATTIGKRIIVPFIATPMASWAKEKFIDPGLKGNKENNQNSQKTNSNPAQVPNIKIQGTNSQKLPQEFKGNLLSKYTAK